MRAWMLSIGVALLLGGCPTDPGTGTGDGNGNVSNVSLSRDVQPIMTDKCAGCHSVGGFAERSGIPVLLNDGETHSQIVNVASAVDDTLTFVVPGDPDASYFLEKVASDAPTRGARMPLFGAPLSDAESETIRTWILEGAEDN